MRLFASLAVLALSGFDGVAQDDRREEQDRPDGEPADDQRDQRRRVVGGEADEEGDDGDEIAAVPRALAEAAQAVDAGPARSDGVVHQGSHPRSSRRWRSCRRRRLSEKWRRATAWLVSRTLMSGWFSHASRGAGSDAGNQLNPKARSSSATG